jgi:hypothetical protein
MLLKTEIEEREILVAVVVVAGNVDFRPMCCTTFGLVAVPVLGN